MQDDDKTGRLRALCEIALSRRTRVLNRHALRTSHHAPSEIMVSMFEGNATHTLCQFSSPAFALRIGGLFNPLTRTYHWHLGSSVFCDDGSIDAAVWRMQLAQWRVLAGAGAPADLLDPDGDRISIECIGQRLSPALFADFSRWQAETLRRSQTPFRGAIDPLNPPRFANSDHQRLPETLQIAN